MRPWARQGAPRCDLCAPWRGVRRRLCACHARMRAWDAHKSAPSRPLALPGPPPAALYARGTRTSARATRIQGRRRPPGAPLSARAGFNCSKKCGLPRRCAPPWGWMAAPALVLQGLTERRLTSVLEEGTDPRSLTRLTKAGPGVRGAPWVSLAAPRVTLAAARGTLAAARWTLAAERVPLAAARVTLAAAGGTLAARQGAPRCDLCARLRGMRRRLCA